MEKVEDLESKGLPAGKIKKAVQLSEKTADQEDYVKEEPITEKDSEFLDQER